MTDQNDQPEPTEHGMTMTELLDYAATTRNPVDVVAYAADVYAGLAAAAVFDSVDRPSDANERGREFARLLALAGSCKLLQNLMAWQNKDDGAEPVVVFHGDAGGLVSAVAKRVGIDREDLPPTVRITIRKGTPEADSAHLFIGGFGAHTAGAQVFPIWRDGQPLTEDAPKL